MRPSIWGRILYQVKSGGVGRGGIATLRGDMMRENAHLGVFLTLEEPTEPMRKEAASAGTFFHPLMQKNFPVISIVPIREMVENNIRMEMPISHVLSKKAASAANSTQTALELE